MYYNCINATSRAYEGFYYHLSYWEMQNRWAISVNGIKPVLMDTKLFEIMHDFLGEVPNPLSADDTIIKNLIDLKRF
jgi:hypothetical protein